MDRSRIERHIKPLIGSRKVAALTPPDIAAMQADIAAGKSSRSRGTGRLRGALAAASREDAAVPGRG